MYLYLTARSELEMQLIEAECFTITGAVPDERGIALSESEADVSRAAYIKTCMKVMIRAADLPELYDQLEKIGLSSERFRVSVVKLPRRLKLDSQQVMHQVGARIAGNPDLSAPRTVFLVVATEKEICKASVMAQASRIGFTETVILAQALQQPQVVQADASLPIIAALVIGAMLLSSK